MTVTIRFVKDEDEVTFLLASREESRSPIDIYSPRSRSGGRRRPLTGSPGRRRSGSRDVLAVGEHARQPEQDLGRAGRIALHQLVDEMAAED